MSETVYLFYLNRENHCSDCELPFGELATPPTDAPNPAADVYSFKTEAFSLALSELPVLAQAPPDYALLREDLSKLFGTACAARRGYFTTLLLL